jgi:hypothetical protein
MSAGQVVDEEDLLEEIRRLESELGRIPSEAAMEGHGNFEPQTYLDFFEDWESALEAAGYTVEEFRAGRYTGITDPEFRAHVDELEQGDADDQFRARLLLEIRRLAADLEKTPTVSELNRYGEYSRGAYRNRWESWSEAVSEAGLEPNSGGQGKAVSRDDLLDEVRRLADQLGHRPTQQDLDERGKYSRTPYYREFGSWTAACKAALQGDDNGDT